jgi:hypothetical protein
MSDVLLLFASGAISVAVSRFVKLKMLAMLIVFSEDCKITVYNSAAGLVCSSLDRGGLLLMAVYLLLGLTK